MPLPRRVIALLTAEQRAQLLERSDLAGLRQLAMHVGALSTTAALLVFAALPWPLWLAVCTLHGVLLAFLFTALHESVHGTPFATQRLNTFLGWTCGFILGLQADWFRHFHLAHHRHTQDPGRDPELACGKPSTRRALLLYLSGAPVWKAHVTTLWRNAVREIDDPFVRPAQRAPLRRNARRMLLGYAAVLLASVATASTLALTLWLLPLLLGQPFLRAFLLAEHAGCGHSENAFDNTRTTLAHPLVRALAWNMPYHAEHHAWAGVPFHRLPALHALVRPHLQVTARGYLSFLRDYWAATHYP